VSPATVANWRDPPLAWLVEAPGGLRHDGLALGHHGDGFLHGVATLLAARPGVLASVFSRQSDS
jgi:hypothetical protein